jgi:hypothetical protein
MFKSSFGSILEENFTNNKHIIDLLSHLNRHLMLD